MNFYVIDARGYVKAGGKVTDFNLVMPEEFMIAGSPVTVAGEITVSKVNQDANVVYAGPASGSAAAPAFRALVPDDYPSLTPPTVLGSMWSPDAPPASPGSLDDEFDDASFNTTLWTEFDPSNTVTVSETTSGLQLHQPSQATLAVGGIYQDLPSGDFTFWTKVSILGNQAGNVAGGIALYDDATNSGTAFRLYMLQYTASGTYLSWERFHDYAAHDISYGERSDSVLANTGYLRIRRNGSDYFFDWSTDGFGWTHLLSGELSTAPLHIGPCVLNLNSGADLYAQYEFFRYTDSDVGLTGIMEGHRATLYV